MGVVGSTICVEQVLYSHLIVYPSDMLNTDFSIGGTVPMSIFLSVSLVCLETSLEESQSVNLPQYGVPIRRASKLY